MNLIDIIYNNRDNQALLSLLGLHYQRDKYVKIGKGVGSPFDEGSKIFFYKYGLGLPDEVKAELSGNNILINPSNGLIFGFHWGRCTFLIRCDFEKISFKNSDEIRKGITLDDYVNFTLLGENWCLVDYLGYENDIKAHFKLAYELSKKEV
jgi:hypothetical protein